eukprot:6195725-Pleurochrysis_carterae.AAC.1
MSLVRPSTSCNPCPPTYSKGGARPSMIMGLASLDDTEVRDKDWLHVNEGPGKDGQIRIQPSAWCSAC